MPLVKAVGHTRFTKNGSESSVTAVENIQRRRSVLSC